MLKETELGRSSWNPSDEVIFYKSGSLMAKPKPESSL